MKLTRSCAISGAPFISLHFRAVVSLNSLSSVRVALRASQLSQSNPQQAINRFFIRLSFKYPYVSIPVYFALSHSLFPLPDSGPFPPQTNGFPNPGTDCGSPALSPHPYSSKDSPLGRSSDCSFIWRLTPRIIPNDKLVNTTDEPPRLISGNVCPVTGK